LREPALSPWGAVLRRFHSFDSLLLTAHLMPNVLAIENRNVFADLLVETFVPRAFFPEKPQSARAKYFSRTIWRQGDPVGVEANIGEVARSNWLYPQIYLFLITFVPVFLAANFGVTFVTDIINGLPTWVLNGLAVGGGVLPAIGIAMNMRFIFRGPVVPYFFLGYFLFVVTQVVTSVTISMAVVAVVGLAIAALHVFYVGDRDQGAAMRAAAASK